MSQGWGKDTGNLGSRDPWDIADSGPAHPPHLPFFCCCVSMCQILLALGLFFFFLNKHGLPENPNILVKF